MIQAEICSICLKFHSRIYSPLWYSMLWDPSSSEWLSIHNFIYAFSVHKRNIMFMLITTNCVDCIHWEQLKFIKQISCNIPLEKYHLAILLVLLVLGVADAWFLSIHPVILLTKNQLCLLTNTRILYYEVIYAYGAIIWSNHEYPQFLLKYPLA